jgi:predicted RNA-binding protein YlqC (UPF0109 family)
MSDSKNSEWFSNVTKTRGATVNDKHPIADLLERLAGGMCHYPDALRFEHRFSPASATLTVRAHAADTSRLIGEGGKNYQALRTLMQAAGARRGLSVTLARFMEPVTGQPERHSATMTENPDWPREKLIRLLRDTLDAVFEFSDRIEVAEYPEATAAMTTFEVYISPLEKPDLYDLLKEPLWRIFDAIGRRHGRVLNVTVATAKVTRPESMERQPKTAAGRFSGEVGR